VRATLSLSIPLYTGGARSAERAAALAEREAVRLAVMDLRRRIQAQIASQWAVLQASEHSERAQSRRVLAAEEALDGVLEGQAAGLTSILNILDAERELLAARLGLLDAELAFAQARIDLAASTMSLEILR
jgi:outer membrane protein